MIARISDKQTLSGSSNLLMAVPGLESTKHTWLEHVVLILPAFLSSLRQVSCRPRGASSCVTYITHNLVPGYVGSRTSVLGAMGRKEKVWELCDKVQRDLKLAGLPRDGSATDGTEYPTIKAMWSAELGLGKIPPQTPVGSFCFGMWCIDAKDVWSTVLYSELLCLCYIILVCYEHHKGDTSSMM